MRLHRLARLGIVFTGLALSLAGAAAPGQDRPEPETMKVLVAGSPPSKGPIHALVTVVAFVDFQCPSCRELSQSMATLPAEEAHAIRIIIRHKPLLFHTWAREAATVSICVDSQDPDAFWKLHDFVFAQQNELTAENVKPRLLQFVTEELHIDRRAVNACLESHGYEDTLARDHQLVEQFNIRETPTVFVNGRRYVGLKSAEDLKLAIDAALGAARQVSEPASTPPK